MYFQLFVHNFKAFQTQKQAFLHPKYTLLVNIEKRAKSPKSQNF